MLFIVPSEGGAGRTPPPPPRLSLALYEVLQVMSLRVVKGVVKALLKVMEVLKVVKLLSPPSPPEVLVNENSFCSTRFTTQMRCYNDK